MSRYQVNITAHNALDIDAEDMQAAIEVGQQTDAGVFEISNIEVYDEETGETMQWEA